MWYNGNLTLRLSEQKIIETNPDSPNVYYASHSRPERDDDKLESILNPIVDDLKTSKIQMPLILIYKNLENI